MNRMSRRVVLASAGGVLVAASVFSGSRPADAYVQEARTNVTASRNVTTNTNYNANRNVNVNDNVNVNRNVNVNAGYDSWGHPVSSAVAVTATAVAVGTIATSLPSSGCTAISVGGVAYQKCGPNYYQPHVVNGATQYVVVGPPQ